MKLCDTCIYQNENEYHKPCIVRRDDCEYYKKERGDMSREEAIKELQESHDIMRSYDIDESESRLMTALDMAIKALEQEPVLDKIKAEIEQKQYYFMDDKDYDEGIRFGLMLAYQTVDKYKTESEEEE